MRQGDGDANEGVGCNGWRRDLEKRCLDTAQSLVMEAGYFAIAGQNERWTRSTENVEAKRQKNCSQMGLEKWEWGYG